MCYVFEMYFVVVSFCQLFCVHVLECSTCQSVWGENRQVSWGRGLGEQDGGGMRFEVVLQCVFR